MKTWSMNMKSLFWEVEKKNFHSYRRPKVLAELGPTQNRHIFLPILTVFTLPLYRSGGEVVFCWTSGWNLAHSWETVICTSYIQHAAFSHILPTLPAKEEEWTEEIWLTPIFIYFMELWHQTEKWNAGNQEEQIQASVLFAANAPGSRRRCCVHQHIFVLLFFCFVPCSLIFAASCHARPSSAKYLQCLLSLIWLWYLRFMDPEDNLILCVCITFVFLLYLLYSSKWTIFLIFRTWYLDYDICHQFSYTIFIHLYLIFIFLCLYNLYLLFLFNIES